MPFQAQTLDTYRKASLVALWVGTLLYGIYVVLFGICLYIFRSRKHTQNLVLMISAFVMFSLSTAHIITTFISTFYGVLNPDELSPERVALASGHIYITNNIIADGIIVYRCYIVWGSRKRIIFLPCVLLLATAVIGYTFRITIELIALSLATSITSTALTAGRIMWIAWETKKHLGKHFAERYNTAASVVVESGLMYSISLIIFLAVYINGPGSNSTVGPSKVYPSKTQPITTFPYYFPASYIVYVALAQIMGIVSTLIIVRVGLGVATSNPSNRTPPPSSGRSLSNRSMYPQRRPLPVSVELSTIVINTETMTSTTDQSGVSRDDKSRQSLEGEGMSSVDVTSVI